MGVVLSYFFIQVLTSYGGFVALRQGWDVPRGAWWIGAAVCFYFFANTVNWGFTRTWGWRPQLILGLLLLAAATFDLLYYGSIWGPPLALLVLLLMTYVLGHVALSFILAGVFATPG